MMESIGDVVVSVALSIVLLLAVLLYAQTLRLARKSGNHLPINRRLSIAAVVLMATTILILVTTAQWATVPLIVGVSLLIFSISRIVIMSIK
jgi:hypothetical protein